MNKNPPCQLKITPKSLWKLFLPYYKIHLHYSFSFVQPFPPLVNNWISDFYSFCLFVCVFVFSLQVINEHLAISCGKTLIQVILDKSFLMGMRRTDVRLNNPKCLPTDNGTHFLFQTNFTSCGTKLIDTDNFFIYENTIQEKPPQGIITRLADVDIPFR